jgi:hypothetical protein
VVTVRQPPIYSGFHSIYPGPHYNKKDSEEPEIDSRVWFSIPVEFSKENFSFTYLIFPFGGTDQEITEIEIDAGVIANSWTG